MLVKFLAILMYFWMDGWIMLDLIDCLSLRANKILSSLPFVPFSLDDCIDRTVLLFVYAKEKHSLAYKSILVLMMTLEEAKHKTCLERCQTTANQ